MPVLRLIRPLRLFPSLRLLLCLLSLVLLLGAGDIAVAGAQVRIVVERGAVERGAYVNKSIGLTYRFPSAWLATAEPGGEAGPLRVLLRAIPPPRPQGGADYRRLTLLAEMQK